MTKGKADTVSKEAILAKHIAIEKAARMNIEFREDETIYAAMEEYAQAYAQTESKWIEAKDDKPELRKWVLLFNGHWIGVGRRNELDLDDDSEMGWEDETSEYISPIPTHWQPLPPNP